MSDSEIVASIVAGEPEGLAAAYDKYASDLYGYCQSLLQEPDDAADAVQDTFVIAASKLHGLRDPERLRAWLFAVARNECLHRLKARHASSSLQDAPEPTDDSVDVGGRAERAETVALVRAAVGGLNDGERDIITQLWHGLEVPEVAAVLGVSRNHAYALFSRARDQLEASVAVLLVGRAGRRDCAKLDSLLGDWDGRLTALLRKRVGRHIDKCPVCSARRRKEFTPALLYGLSPGAVLGLAALHAGTAVSAVRQAAEPLAGVRDEVLRAVAAHPAGIGGGAARSINPFGGNGFPQPARYGHGGILPQPHFSLTSLAAGGTAAAAAATTAVVLVVVPHPPLTPGLPGGGLTADAPAPEGLSAAPPGATGGPSLTLRARTSPTGGTRSAPGLTGPSALPGPTVSAGPTGRPVITTTVTGTTAAAPGGGPTGTPTVPVASPTSAAPATTAPSTTGPSTTAPSTGTLSVSPTSVLLSPLLGGSLTLTASGGPVSWSISEPASLLGKLTVSPMSGTLSAGSSVTVTLTVTGLASLDSQLTVSPGGQVVTVVIGLV